MTLTKLSVENSRKFGVRGRSPRINQRGKVNGGPETSAFIHREDSSNVKYSGVSILIAWCHPHID